MAADGSPMVPLRFIENLERAQLEILAIALYREDRQNTPWLEAMGAVREVYRTAAHNLMLGNEPKERTDPWQQPR